MRATRISKLAALMGSKKTAAGPQPMPAGQPPMPGPVGGAGATMPAASPQTTPPGATPQTAAPQPQPQMPGLPQIPTIPPITPVAGSPQPAAPVTPQPAAGGEPAEQPPVQITQVMPNPFQAPIIQPPSMPPPVSGMGIYNKGASALDARVDFARPAFTKVAAFLSTRESAEHATNWLETVTKNMAIAGVAKPGLAAAGGGLIGAGVGAGIGALVPSKDKDGETHRLRNAAIGAGIGGIAGAGTAGLGAQVIRENLNPVDRTALDMSADGGASGKMVEEAQKNIINAPAQMQKAQQAAANVASQGAIGAGVGGGVGAVTALATKRPVGKLSLIAGAIGGLIGAGKGLQ